MPDSMYMRWADGNPKVNICMHICFYIHKMALILKNHSNPQILLLHSVNVRLCDCRGPLTKESPTEKAL